MSIFSDLFGGADKKAAELFGQAAQVGAQLENIEKVSGQIQTEAAKRQEYAQLGQVAGATGANNLTTSGSAWDVIRQSQSQGAIQNELIGTQSEMQVEGTQMQVDSLLAEQQEAEQAASSSILGLFGTGMSVLGLGLSAYTAFSDRRLKHNISFLGWYNGFPFYRYQFWWSRKWRVGVLAQDLLKVEPELCKRHWTGFWRVDYRRLLNA